MDERNPKEMSEPEVRRSPLHVSEPSVKKLRQSNKKRGG